MNYKGHLAGGFITFFGILYLLTMCGIVLAIEYKVLFFLICLFGSLFPDIDTKSKIQLWIYRAACITLLGTAWTFQSNPYTLFSAIILLIPLTVRHRGMFHNIWFLTFAPTMIALIMGFLYPTAWKLFYYATMFFISGVYSHLILDRSG
jgi:membrane-bound metal-dependent hydrolase YbcI (DUF457 family)